MRVVIVDDSRLARLELRQQLSDLTEVEIVAEAASVSEALDVLSEKTVDLLLLDIDLPDGDGFDLLQQTEQVPQVIFVTAFNEYAIKSFEFNALDYLLKPVRKERLIKSLEKVKIASNNQKLTPDRRIFIKDREHCYFICIDDIYAFEALGNYTKVHLRDAAPCVYKSIGSIFERLDPAQFFKASRSWLVNTHFIENIEALDNGSFSVHLKNRQKVMISKRQAAEFKRRWAL
uniref:LytR/AlgR family response regulator transcription factor n=1 Tax=Ningiella ruwaisensis TaxID=2364274 RepID=UPI00109F979F|nr:LytTR family DNA-binding domain-containing protein [Ningiella ruwaisensis]